jgi:dTMP kinase
MAWSKSRGFECIFSREPTDGPHGTELRRSAQTGRLSPEAELDLFMRDRKEHVQSVIEPALAGGSLVILDRYYFSTAAYQGARGLDPEAIIAANEQFAPVPDLVLLLDLDPEIGHGRIGTRGARPDDFEELNYQATVRRMFLGLERPFIHRIDAARQPDAVFDECVKTLAAALERRGFPPGR